ncbi:hypothetical protein NC653_030989 [Populus alba x Populus x berolinensis]|uniref:Uncharacterized protein n=1 Tax=Populus alba x Populus x berolinensis TaxID=444605 RepID=A0AAD6LXR2_9ROSI|nr:hypothetical protein NC653_030989 [Populus alba x Populus x berolinensis]
MEKLRKQLNQNPFPRQQDRTKSRKRTGHRTGCEGKAKNLSRPEEATIASDIIRTSSGMEGSDLAEHVILACITLSGARSISKNNLAERFCFVINWEIDLLPPAKFIRLPLNELISTLPTTPDPN